MVAKGTGKASKNPSPSAQGCIVTSETSIGKACATRLQKHLNCGHVSYEMRQYSSGASSLHFTTYPSVKAMIKGAECPALPLGDSIWLHLAIDLEFVVKGRLRVKHISIDILEGEATQAQKTSLLRAEWMMHSTALEDGHAQPHWHAIGAAGVTTEDDFEAYLSSGAGFGSYLTEETKPKPHAAFKHFHYAMVTSWHQDPQTGYCHTLESQEAAIAWIIGCISYIQHQLSHVTKKSGHKTVEEVA